MYIAANPGLEPHIILNTAQRRAHASRTWRVLASTTVTVDRLALLARWLVKHFVDLYVPPRSHLSSCPSRPLPFFSSSAARTSLSIHHLRQHHIKRKKAFLSLPPTFSLYNAPNLLKSKQKVKKQQQKQRHHGCRNFHPPHWHRLPAGRHGAPHHCRHFVPRHRQHLHVARRL